MEGFPACVDIKLKDVTLRPEPSHKILQRITRCVYSSVRHAEPQPAGENSILQNISGTLQGGKLTAILGPSGAGKSSLLSLIGGHPQPRLLRQTGSISFTSQARLVDNAPQAAKVRIASVAQHDRLVPHLTVRETLLFAARLRFEGIRSPSEICALVNNIIGDLGLQNCEDNRIGHDSRGGCSAGQRRCVSIGIHLLKDDSVLLLDEPTTGLDAASTLHLVKLLKKLADRGKTVVLTMHQPRSEIWTFIDHLFLLAQGSCAYAGPVHGALGHFERLGYPCPDFVNLFDHVVDLVATDSRSSHLLNTSTAQVKLLLAAYKFVDPGSANHDGPPELFPYLNMQRDSGRQIGWPRRLAIHTRRNLTVGLRDNWALLANVSEAALLGTFSGFVFFQLGDSLSDILSREGALYSACVLQSYIVLLLETYRLSQDVQVFDRERRDGVVDAATFVAARRLARFPLDDFPMCMIYASLLYYMANLRQEYSLFVLFTVVQLLLHQICALVATVCVAFSRQYMTASLLANLAYTLEAISAGFIINTQSMAVWLRWMKWIAYAYYAFCALCINEFKGRTFSCSSGARETDPMCRPDAGDKILSGLGIPFHDARIPLWMLLCFVAGFSALSVLVLHVNNVRPAIKRQQPTKASSEGAPDSSVSDEKVCSSKDWASPSLRLTNWSVQLQLRHSLKHQAPKTLVHPLTTIFEPGILNVVLGPSGCGKSTLLRSLTGHLPRSFRSQYTCTGELDVLGCIGKTTDVASYCGFVSHSDDWLLPALTVRETLRFTALLRLSSRWTDADKLAHADSMISRMGLEGCTEKQVGGEKLRGISGGEKSRVNLTAQIISGCSILVCDEPTSGLDSSTTVAVIAALQKLANQGKTIIMSIHQPSSNLYKSFGNLVLLGRHGRPAYCGPADCLVPYLQSRGFRCPLTMNPADFAMDVVSSAPMSIDQYLPVPLTYDDTRRPTASPLDLESDPSCRPQVDRRSLFSNAGITDFRESTQYNGASSCKIPQYSIVSFRYVLPILMQRTLLNLWRQPALLMGRVYQFMGMGILLCLCCAPLDHSSPASVQTRIGLIQQQAAVIFVGMLNSVAIYLIDRDVFFHETTILARSDMSTYSATALFASYTMIEVPLNLLGSLLFSFLTVLAVRFNPSVSFYALSVLVNFLMVSCGEFVGIIVLTLARDHIGTAVAVMSSALSMSMLLGGVFAPSAPRLMKCLNFVNPVKWYVGALTVQGLAGMEFHCDDGGHFCPITTGEEALEAYKLDEVSVERYVGILLAVTVVYRVVAYVTLRNSSRR